MSDSTNHDKNSELAYSTAEQVSNIGTPGEEQGPILRVTGLGMTCVVILVIIIAAWIGGRDDNGGRKRTYTPSVADFEIFETPPDLEERWRPISEHEKRQRAVIEMLNADSADW